MFSCRNTVLLTGVSRKEAVSVWKITYTIIAETEETDLRLNSQRQLPKTHVEHRESLCVPQPPHTHHLLALCKNHLSGISQNPMRKDKNKTIESVVSVVTRDQDLTSPSRHKVTIGQSRVGMGHPLLVATAGTYLRPEETGQTVSHSRNQNSELI